MRILFWADGFWPRLGGIETQSLHLIEEMQKRGHLYQVLAQKDAPHWKEEEIYKGIPISRFDFNGILKDKNLKSMNAIKEHLKKVMVEFQPDLIHLDACLGGSAFAFLLCMKEFHRPIAMTAHAPYLYQGQLSPLFEKVCFFVDQIACVSNWVLNEMRCHLPTLNSKLRCICNGLSIPEAKPQRLSFFPPLLLCFGRLSKEKGFDKAIIAFSLLKKRGSLAHLVIAGGGPERPFLENLVQELGLTLSVTFTGVLSQEEVLSWFNRATLVIVPSLSESFGLVILEAMQLERPVIAFRIQGIPEVIAEGETGLLVDPEDPLALCCAIETLLLNPEKAIKMGIEGRKRALEKFTIQQNAARYEALYFELIQSSKLPGSAL